MKRLLACASVVALLGGCAQFNSSVSAKLDSVQQDVGQLLATGQAQFASANAVALAATPPDQDFINCYAAADQVLAAAQKVQAASISSNNGAVVAAEIATLYTPGSDQYNWAQSTLVSGCSAKITKAAGNFINASGVLAAIPALLKLAPLAGA